MDKKLSEDEIFTLWINEMAASNYWEEKYNELKAEYNRLLANEYSREVV